MFDYLKCLFLNDFIPAVFSTAGVFSLTFLVMYIHYKMRKKFYTKIFIMEESNLEGMRQSYNSFKKLISKIYQKEEIQDSMDFFNKIDFSRFNEEQGKIIIDLWKELSDREFAIDKKECDILHIKKYSFKIYLLNILSSKYPDSYWKNKK